MSKRKKLLERMRRNPQSVRFAEIDSLLLAFGFERRQRGTSHVRYTNGERQLTIPYRKPFILPVYVLQMLAVIEDLADAEPLD